MHTASAAAVLELRTYAYSYYYLLSSYWKLKEMGKERKTEMGVVAVFISVPSTT